MSRTAVRRWIAGVGYGLGLTQALTRAGDRWRVRRRGTLPALRRGPKDRFLVLIYHRVNQSSAYFSIERTTPEDFRSQMRYLAAQFHVLPLSEITRRVKSGEPIPPRAVAVTFDDGYVDNYTHAFPILHDLRIPATIFLTTGWIESDAVPWFDRVLHGFERSTRLAVALPGEEGEVFLGEGLQRHRIAIRALYALMRLPNSERLEAQERLIEALAPDSEPRNQMLHWSEVRQMADHGIEFGAHTVSHPILTRLPESEARREILDSKERIQAEIGRPVSLFAYPVGRPVDYSPEVLRWVAEAGYGAAVTTEVGANARGDDLYRLRRIKPLGADVPTFALGLGVHYVTDWNGA